MTSLYRLYNDKDALLYIGIAGNPGRRFEQHAKDKPWWSEVSSVKIEHFVDRQLALQAEATAIKSEKPRYNVVHNCSPAVLPPVPAPVRLHQSKASDGLWEFASLGTGYTRVCDLYLYPELEGSARIDDCDSDDGIEQFEYYIQSLWFEDPEWMIQDSVPIAWFVMSSDDSAGICEVAPFWQDNPEDDDFLSFYTWPCNPRTLDPVDWVSLPVLNPRFPAFAQVLGWCPSPLQRTAPLRSLLASRGMELGPARNYHFLHYD